LNLPNSSASGNLANASDFQNKTAIMIDFNTAVFSRTLPDFLFLVGPAALLATGILA